MANTIQYDINASTASGYYLKGHSTASGEYSTASGMYSAHNYNGGVSGLSPDSAPPVSGFGVLPTDSGLLMDVEEDLKVLVRVADRMNLTQIQFAAVDIEVTSMKAEIDAIRLISDRDTRTNLCEGVYERLRRAEESIGRLKVSEHHGMNSTYQDIDKENDILISTIGDISSDKDITIPNLALDMDFKDEVLNIRFSNNAGLQYMNMVKDLESVPEPVPEPVIESNVGYDHLRPSTVDELLEGDILAGDSSVPSSNLDFDGIDDDVKDLNETPPITTEVVEEEPPVTEHTEYKSVGDIIEAFEAQDDEDVVCIGVGGDGKVYRFEGFAIKVYNEVNVHGLEVYELLGSATNTNVIESKHHTKNDVTYEVMDFYPLGSLGDNVDFFKGKFDLQKELFDQLLDGIEFLHGKNIQHRDLKTGNVLVESLEPLQIKVCDFGRSRANANSMSITQSVGTFKFMAPEALAGMPTSSSDLFSLGMIMAVIGSGGDPFTNSGHLIDNELDWSKINVDVPMKSLIKGLTIKDQYKRGVSAFKEGWVTRLNAWIESWFEDTRRTKPTFTDRVLVSGSKLIPPHGAPPRQQTISDVMDFSSITGRHNRAEAPHKPTFFEY
jgi:hypothetical protein